MPQAKHGRRALEHADNLEREYREHEYQKNMALRNLQAELTHRHSNHLAVRMNKNVVPTDGTLISIGEWRDVNDNINNSSLNASKSLQENRKALQEKSQQRVKNWENTILGQRKKRLAAQAERLVAAEEERVKVDVEWEQIRKQERNAAIARAQTLIFYERPEVKRLHSSLLLSNVLQERAKQIEMKKTNDIRAQLESFYQATTQVKDTVQQMENHAKEMQEKEAKAAKELAEYLYQQMQEKSISKTLEKEKDRKAAQGIIEKALEEEKALQELERHSRRSNSERFAQELDGIVAERKEGHRRQQQNEEEQLDNMHRYNSFKGMLGERRREVEQVRFGQRQQMVAKVSELHQTANQSQERKKDDFVEITAASINQRQLDEERRRQLNREQTKEAIEANRIQTIQEKESAHERSVESARYRRRLLENQYEQELARKAAQRSEGRHRESDIKIFQESQVAKKRQEMAHRKVQRMEDGRRVANALHEDITRFREYAHAMLGKWKEGEKDIRPMVIELTHESQLCGVERPVRFAEKYKVNTYRRLGFGNGLSPHDSLSTDQDDSADALSRGTKAMDPASSGIRATAVGDGISSASS